MSDDAVKIAARQGAYYCLTGLWPLLHMKSFEAVTGRKRERWLVLTVGMLVGAIGGGLLMAVREKRVDPALRNIAWATATGIAALEFPLALTGRIRAIYAADALLETCWAARWTRLARTPTRTATPRQIPDTTGHTAW